MTKTVTIILIGLIFSYFSLEAQPGNALDFDDLNDYVTAPSIAAYVTQEFTAEAWVKSSAASTNVAVACHDDINYDGWDLRLLDGSMAMSLGYGTNYTTQYSPDIGLNDGNWHHIAGTMDAAGNYIYYADGVIIFTGSLPTYAPPVANDLIIGMNNVLLSWSAFGGSIDEVRVWNIARTQCEIQGYMNTELVGNEAGLVAYYNFNIGVAGADNTGLTTLPELSVNANNGTLNTFILNGPTSNFVTSGANITTIGVFQDILAPVADLALLSDLTDECEVTPTAPTATDICAGTINGTSIEIFPITTQGTTVITWTYDDGNGNTITQNQNVIINDVTDPVAICQDLTIALDSNGTASIDVNAMYFTGTKSNQVWYYDGTTATELYNPAASGTSGPVVIKYVPENDSIYWGGGNYHEVYAAPSDGSGTPYILPNSLEGNERHGLDIDYANNRYFYTAGEEGIYVANLDGSGTAIQLVGGFNSGPTSVEYNQVNGKLYFNEHNDNHIYSMNDDGTGLDTLFDATDGVAGPRAVAIDVPNGYIYWSNKNNGNVMMGNIDGTGTPIVLYTGQSGIYGLYLYEATQTLYWTTFDDGSTSSWDIIFKAPADGSGIPTIVTEGNYGSIRGVCVKNVDMLINNGSTDNCMISGITATQSTFDCSNIGTNSVTMTVTDYAGNTATCNATVTVIDTINPMPINAVLDTIDSFCEVTLVAPEAYDNCGNFAATTTDPTFYDTDGTYTVTWDYDNLMGYTYSQPQTIIVHHVVDQSVTAAQTLLCPNNSTTIDVGSTENDLSYFLRDNANDSIIDGPIAGTGSAISFNTGNLVSNMTYNVYAQSSNTALEFDVSDDYVEIPSDASLIPTNLTVEAWIYTYGYNSYDVVVMKNDWYYGGYCMYYYDNSIRFAINDYWDYNVSAEITSGQWYHVAGTYDGAELKLYLNGALVSTVADTDGIDPNGDNLTIGADYEGSYVWNGKIDEVRIWDVARSDTEISNAWNTPLTGSEPGLISYYNFDIGSGSTLPDLTGNGHDGTLTNMDIANAWVDGKFEKCGAEMVQTATVVVEDIDAPVPDVATLPDLSDACSVILPAAPTAVDNCAGVMIATTTETSPILGSTTIVWTFDDGNGNITTQNQNVTINDLIAPVADLASLPDLSDPCSVTPTVPTATDNCAGAMNATTTETFPILASTTIVWTFEDGNGNITTQNQNVTISDATAPVADLASLADIIDECSVTPAIPTATDNCMGTINGTTTETFPITAQGTTVITWTYEDGNGNLITQDQNVIITDVTAPVADIASLVDATDECSVTPTIPTATDNCLGTINGTTTETFPIIAQGTTVITWTYDDGNGNTSTQTQNVIITDVTDPTIICQNDTVVCDPLVNYLAPVGQDNCTVQSTVLTLGLGSGSTFPLGITTEEYTVTDNVGNTATCSFTITVATPSVVDLGIDTIICQWDTLVLDAGVFDTYLWSEGSTTQTISVDSTGLGLGTHVFYVEITDTNGCVAVDTISITIDICSSIAKNDLENLIQVYPNPSTGIYTISADRDYSFVITDITGKQIYNGKLESTESQIDISDQAQGIYLIKFVSDEHNTTIKLIKK